MVPIGAPVPGEYGETFAKFGEGLSVSSSGRHVAFWGAWGEGTRTLVRACPVDGNTALIDFCNEQHPDGFETTVPVHQGIFVYDTVRGSLTGVAKTGRDDIDEFLYWVYSGRPPNAGGGEEGDEAEPPRWRSSAFASVWSRSGPNYQVAFKAPRGTDGIHVRSGATSSLLPLWTAIAVGDPGPDVDPEAPAGSGVTAIGLEREGLRKGRLAITRHDAPRGRDRGGDGGLGRHVPDPRGRTGGVSANAGEREVGV